MGFLDRLFSRGKRQQSFEFRARELAGNGGYDVAAVGESNYQNALWAAAGGHQPDRVRVEVKAALVREPDNEYDRNAVAVYCVGGGKVAYLSRDDAVDYAEPLEQLASEGLVGACDAVIVGGAVEGTDRQGFLGIWLDLVEPDAVLGPPQERSSARREREGTGTGTTRAIQGSAGKYRGKHYTSYVDDVRSLKRHGALDEATALLRGLIEVVEAEAAAEGVGVAPWYYEQLAIVLRKQKDLAGEVAILERFAEQPHAPGASPPELLERLAKARARLEKSLDR